MKKILIGMVMVFLIINNIGCKTDKAQAPKLDKLRISYVKLPLNIPSIVEKKLQSFENEFAKNKIQVEFPEITAGPKMTEAIAAGSLDFCNALGGTSAIMAAANGVDLKIIGIYSRAPKAFTIMAANPNIKSMADLRGKKIAGPKGTILHQLLLAALADQGLKVSDVQFVNMNISAAVTALLTNKIDAALVAGPAVIKASQAGANVIVTGEKLLDATIVIAVRTKLLEEHPDLVKRYMKVHHSSLEYMRKNPERVIQMASEETKISLNDVKRMYSWYDFNPQISDRDIAELEKTQKFLKINGLLTKEIKIKDILQDLSGAN